jgi:hypothetical protein
VYAGRYVGGLAGSAWHRRSIGARARKENAMSVASRISASPDKEPAMASR